MIIFETNDEIEKLVEYFTDSILSFRKKHPSSRYRTVLMNFNRDVVCKWMEDYQLNGIEPDNDEDERIKNIILDTINIIKKIDNKKGNIL